MGSILKPIFVYLFLCWVCTFVLCFFCAVVFIYLFILEGAGAGGTLNPEHAFYGLSRGLKKKKNNNNIKTIIKKLQ